MKAQVAVEFVIVFAVFLIAVIFVAASVWERTANIEKSSLDFEASSVLSMVANTLNAVLLEGHGFSTNLTLPNTIRGLDYNITVASYTVWLKINGYEYSKRTLVEDLSSPLKKDVNILRNVNGSVVIE